MQRDFHYYATYCAATIAGYSHEEACDICWSAYHVDKCNRSFIASVSGPYSAATTQSKGELANMIMDKDGIHEITRIWSSFHFLPKDLYPTFDSWRSRTYKEVYALICGPNSPLVKQTIERAHGKGLQAIGIALHVLADTWAHTNFAGTPTMVINNRDNVFFEVASDGSEEKLKFTLNAALGDNIEKRRYISSIYQDEEHTTMNLGHGRVGHLPDYSFMRFRYRPAWKGGVFITKDNPADYYRAFTQMVYALKYFRGEVPEFELNTYAEAEVEPWRKQIEAAINKRCTLNGEDWKALGERLSGHEIPDYDHTLHSQEFIEAEDKTSTFLGAYFDAAQRQKHMVGTAIREANIRLAGIENEIYWAFVAKEDKYLRKLKKLLNPKAAKNQ